MKFFEFIISTFAGRLILLASIMVSVTAYGSVAHAATYVIGDSIAVGIANANGLDRSGDGRWRKSGKDTITILRYIDNFIATGKSHGAVVILSSGASNSTYERPSGTGRDLDIRPIRQQIGKLKAAGSLVFLVGTGSGSSSWIRNRSGSYRVNFRAQNVNGQLARLAREQDVVFLGPLESYGRLPDGIHPSGHGAQQIYDRVRQNLNP